MKMLMAIVAGVLLAVAAPVQAGNCQAGLAFPQLAAPYCPPTDGPPVLDPGLGLGAPDPAAYYAYQQQQQLALQRQLAYRDALAARGQGGYGYSQSFQTTTYYNGQASRNFDAHALQAARQRQLDYQFALERQRQRDFNRGQGQRFRNQGQGQRFRDATGGGVTEIRPTGLARVLGLGGPDIRVDGAGRVNVQPTGLARLLGTGGPRIQTR